MRKRISIFFICMLLIGTGFLPVINCDNPTLTTSAVNNWWNTDWHYCKLLTLDNAVNNYQMLINVIDQTIDVEHTDEIKRLNEIRNQFSKYL